MPDKNAGISITGKLIQVIIGSLDSYRKEKTRRARECCRRYDEGHNPLPELEHGDLSSFNAKFFDYLD